MFCPTDVGLRKASFWNFLRKRNFGPFFILIIKILLKNYFKTIFNVLNRFETFSGREKNQTTKLQSQIQQSINIKLQNHSIIAMRHLIYWRHQLIMKNSSYPTKNQFCNESFSNLKKTVVIHIRYKLSERYMYTNGFFPLFLMFSTYFFI